MNWQTFVAQLLANPAIQAALQKEAATIVTTLIQHLAENASPSSSTTAKPPGFTS
jgi:hypothetical protein